MNKNDFDRFWTSCVPREARASNENIFEDVIKAIDNAEKWNEHKDTRVIFQNRVIVDRLKKFITEHQKEKWTSITYNHDIMDELQKILGEENGN